MRKILPQAWEYGWVGWGREVFRQESMDSTLGGVPICLPHRLGLLSSSSGTAGRPLWYFDFFASGLQCSYQTALLFKRMMKATENSRSSIRLDCMPIPQDSTRSRGEARGTERDLICLVWTRRCAVC